LTTTTAIADAVVSSSPFDADLLYIFTDVLKIDITQKPLHSIPAGVLHYGVTEWEDFHVLDPLEITTFTYPTSGNTRTNLPPSLVIKLQFLMNFINMRINNVTDTTSLDAKSYKNDEFKIYFDQSWKSKRNSFAAARAS